MKVAVLIVKENEVVRVLTVLPLIALTDRSPINALFDERIINEDEENGAEVTRDEQYSDTGEIWFSVELPNGCKKLVIAHIKDML